MYLSDYDDDEQLGIFGIGRKLKKVARKVAKPVRKVATAAVSINPVFALNQRAARKLRRPLMATLNPLTAAQFLKRKRGAPRTPILNVVNKPPSFQPEPALVPSTQGFIPLPAPAASIPTEDYEGDEVTEAERIAYIDDAEPLAEPISGGYAPPGGEESFAPDVPEMIEPGDLKPTPAKKPNTAAWLGGALLLKLLLF